MRKVCPHYYHLQPDRRYQSRYQCKNKDHAHKNAHQSSVARGVGENAPEGHGPVDVSSTLSLVAYAHDPYRVVKQNQVCVPAQPHASTVALTRSLATAHGSEPAAVGMFFSSHARYLQTDTNAAFTPTSRAVVHSRAVGGCIDAAHR